jgi:hypothetical protein
MNGEFYELHGRFSDSGFKGLAALFDPEFPVASACLLSRGFPDSMVKG